MKIGIITPYKHFPGGVESVNSELTTIFEAHGHEVIVVSSDLDYAVPVYIKALTKVFGLPIVTSFIYKTYFKDEFDIVICNGEFSFGISHPKKITFFHGCYYGFYKKLYPCLSLRQKLNLQRHALIQKIGASNSNVVAVSSFIESFLKDQGIQVDRVINNGISTQEFLPETRTNRKSDLIFIGGYNYFGKGFDILEKCAIKLKQNIFCLAGKYELGEGLVALPTIDRARIPNLLNQYKVLIFPSRYEGCQMVPIEAMSCGIPVIISDVGIGQEIRQLCPEFVIDVNNFENEVVDKYSEIMSNYEFYSLKAREIAVNNFDKSKFEREWIDHISTM